MKTINDGKFEDFVMKMIDKGRFEGIEQLVTPRIFVTDHRSNTLLLSMKVHSSKNYCRGKGRVRLSTNNNDTEDSKEVSLGR